jgi:hypothetical protein
MSTAVPIAYLVLSKNLIDDKWMECLGRAKNAPSSWEETPYCSFDAVFW